MSNNRFKLIVLLLLFTFLSSLYGSNIDSLKKILLTSANGTIKIKTLFSIGEYFENIDLDSAIFFYNKIIEITQKQLANKKLKLQLRNNYIFLKAKALRYIGILYYYKNEYKKAYI
jgi:hypothetical protein